MAGPRKVRIDNLVIDATPEQDYGGDVEATDHPIEDGANPTDHARAMPDRFVATCVVSSVPSNDTDRQQRGPFQAYSGGGYAQGVFEQMVRMKSDRKLHTIVTPLHRYENMLLIGLSAPSRAQYGDAVVFKVTFKQIRIVQSGTAQFVTRPVATKTDKPTTKQQQSKKQGAKEDRVTAIKRFTNSVGLTEAGSGVAP